MRLVLVVLVVAVIVMGQPAASLADTVENSLVVGLAALVLIPADVITFVLNTDAVANGRGRTGAGWTGVVAGGLTTAWGLWRLADNDDDTAPAVVAASGIAVAGMGVWSLLLVGSEPDTPATRSLSLGPALARRIDGTSEARLGLALTF